MLGFRLTFFEASRMIDRINVWSYELKILTVDSFVLIELKHTNLGRKDCDMVEKVKDYVKSDRIPVKTKTIFFSFGEMEGFIFLRSLGQLKNM